MRIVNAVNVIAVAFLAVFAIQSINAQEIILSSFDADADSWTASGGALYYTVTGGNPDGYIEFEDLDYGGGLFLAPSMYLGDLSGYNNGTITFDLKNTQDNGLTMLGYYGVVRLRSNAVFAELDVVPMEYISDWTSFSLSMTAGDWGVTEGEWDLLLADVTTIEIQIDAQSDLYDRAGLDNFCLTPPFLDADDLAQFDARPTMAEISQNHPNPFNPVTTIEYSLPERSQVTIEIYNVLGQKVRTLVDENQPAGSYTATWDGSDASGEPAATGIYLYRFRAGNQVETRKMALLK